MSPQADRDRLDKTMPLARPNRAPDGGSESGPVAATEVFDRLENAQELMHGLAQGDGPRHAGVDQTVPFSGTPVPAAARPTVPHAVGTGGLSARADGEDDASIAEYMERLLRRTNGFSSSVAQTVPASALGVPDAQRATMPLPAPTPAAATGPAPAATEQPPEVRIPKPAPECRTDLTQMRELANINARSALDVHHGRRLAVTLRGNLIVSVVALGASFVLAGMSSNWRSASYLCAVVALFVSTGSIIKFCRGAGQLRQLLAMPAQSDHAEADFGSAGRDAAPAVAEPSA